MRDMAGAEVKLQKSYFDVLGICCTSEVPLIEKILNPLEGVEKVTVLVPSRTVIVLHNINVISPLEIVKVLNQARLEATIQQYGSEKKAIKWPSPHILLCTFLVTLSLFQHYYGPLKWLALAGAAVGMPSILLRSFSSLRRFRIDMNTLMLIAVCGAIALADYTEAGVIVTLFTIAEWLQSRASHKATSGMSTLLSMAPQKAVLAGTGQVVDAQGVKIDTILAIKAGEMVPIDGIVVEGRSEIDEKSLTGESFPVAKQPQSQVWAGTLNLDGYITVRTTALAENSAVAKMARLVEEAENNRSRTQRLIDTFAKYYTPAVIVFAVCVALFPLVLPSRRSKSWFLELALVLLVSSCPCALVLATPVATFCSLLKAARMGLLIKGGDVLENLAKTRVVAMDKTGTITSGEFSIVEFRPTGNIIAMEKLLLWVSSIESKSSHPMATAIVDYARANSVEPKPEIVSEFQAYPGEGIYGEIEGRKIYVGNRRLATRATCQTVANMGDIEKGVTLGYVFSDAELIGIFTLRDTCRTGAQEAIGELKYLGLQTVMVTGDSKAAAQHAQDELGHRYAIDVVHAELLPEDKVSIINDLKAQQGPTTMVGDGMNDAPALAAADVGIAMGISGSAVATETSHITLMSNDLRKIPKAIILARKNQKKIIINICFSVSTKLAIMALAFAGHPILWAAVLVDVGTCLAVILNSMMLLREKKSPKKKKCCSSSHKSHGSRLYLLPHCCLYGIVCCRSKAYSCVGAEDYHHHDEKNDNKGHNGCTNHHHHHRHRHHVSHRCRRDSQNHVPMISSTDHCDKNKCVHGLDPCKSVVDSCCHTNVHHNHVHGDDKLVQRTMDHGCCKTKTCSSVCCANEATKTVVKQDCCKAKGEECHEPVVGCCKNKSKETGLEDRCCLSNIHHQDQENEDDDEKGHFLPTTKIKECGKAQSSCYSECCEEYIIKAGEQDGCCKAESRECQKKDCCSKLCSSMTEASAVGGGCCISDRMEEDCCGGTAVHLHEIVVQ